MKNYFFVAVILIPLSCVASKPPVNIAGKYKCSGLEVVTNQPYTCEMTVEKTGETYSSTATCSDDTAYKGTGIYDKESHTVSTTFINPKREKEIGISVSKVQADGGLNSVWTYLKGTSIGHSKCIKQ